MLSPRYRDDHKPLLKLNDTQLKARRRHLEKLKTGTYQLESQPCPICLAGEDTKLAEKDRHGLPMSVVACKSCGLLRTDPRMDRTSYANFYCEEYRDLYGGKESPDEAFFDAQVVHGKQILSLIPSLPKNALIVEVGCGAGGILEPFRQQDHQVIGCDLGEIFLNYGIQKHGLDLRSCMLRDLELPRAPSLIIYSHVMEHILDLKAELGLIHRLLPADGVLYIEIPSTKNIRQAYQWDFLRLLQNAHTYHFTLRSLTNILSISGFEIIQGDEYVRASFRKVAAGRKSVAVVNDYPDVISFLRATEAWRFRHYLRGTVLFRPLKRFKRAVRRMLGALK